MPCAREGPPSPAAQTQSLWPPRQARHTVLEYLDTEYMFVPMSHGESILLRRRLVLEYDSSIGRAIARLRKEAGLNQEAVAREFCCDQPLISKLEKGQRSLKFSEVNALAYSLGIPRDLLVKRLLDAIDNPGAT